MTRELSRSTTSRAGQIDKTVEYVYDTFDRRVSSKVTDYTTNGSGVAVAGTPVVETYVFDEGTSTPLAPGGRGVGGEGATGTSARGDVIFDFLDSDGSGGNAPAVAKRYLWGQAVDQLFAQEDVAGKALADSDRYLWLLQDKLGTVRDVLDRSGALIARVEYNAFGVITSVTNASGSPVDLPTRFTFTAQEYDPITGNIWFSNGEGRGRWYSPTLNRFLQPDELGFTAGDMNLGRYVGNSPTNYSDPSGLCERGFVESAAWGLASGMATVGYWLTYPTRLLGVDFSSQDRGKAGLWENSGIAGSKTQEVTEYVAMAAATATWGASLLNGATIVGFTELGAVPIGEGLLAQAELELLVAVGTGSPFAYGQIESANRAATASQYGAPGGKIGPAPPPSSNPNTREGTPPSPPGLSRTPPKGVPCPTWQQSAADSQVLARRLGIQRGSGIDAHHVVPGGHSRAAPSQDLLNRYQIDINSAENGVPLVGGRGAPQTTLPRHHRGGDLHSYKGIDAVNRRLENAVSGIDDWATARQALIDELRAIKAEIVAGAFP